MGLSKYQREMEKYIQLLQKEAGWSKPLLRPVLKCCIDSGSTRGFCNVCVENFRYRSGPYYPGFEYPTDFDLLERMSSGLKPFSSFSRREDDIWLEEQIEQRGLYLVRKFRNAWGVLQYNVVKDPRLRLSDLADISRMSEMLGLEIEDRLLVDLEEDSALIYQGLRYGYPFYTLSIEDYVLHQRVVTTLRR